MSDIKMDQSVTEELGSDDGSSESKDITISKAKEALQIQNELLNITLKEPSGITDNRFAN